MSKPTEGGKIVRDPEAVAIDQISRAMARLEPMSAAAVYSWYRRRFAMYDLANADSPNPPINAKA